MSQKKEQQRQRSPRHELTDEQWERLQPLLPQQRTGKPGRPSHDHRRMINWDTLDCQDGGTMARFAAALMAVTSATSAKAQCLQ
jgi:hypothetical protein